MTERETLVFDTSPLSHFARHNWLGVLKAVVGDRQAIIPDVVVDELSAGAVRDSRIQAVLDATWIERRELCTEEEVVAFATFSSFLVKKDRNRGEAGVLALASVTGGIAVIDDGAGRRAAEQHRIPLRPTLALLCEAIQGNCSRSSWCRHSRTISSSASIVCRSVQAVSRHGRTSPAS